MKRAGARAAWKDERGIALPVALMMMVLVSGLAVVSARAAVGTQHQTLRDSNAKRAIQAAAAGVEAATYQMNLLQPPATQCVIRTAAGVLMLSPVGTDGWCATQTEDLGDGTDYTFRVSSATVTAGNGQNLVQRRILSVGRKNGFKRRVLVTTSASVQAPLFAANYAAVSLDSIDFGNNTEVLGGVGSNGNIALRNSAEVCGAATPGVGKTLTLNNSASVCSGYPTSAATVPFNLPPVDQKDAPTANDNARICAVGPGSDPCTGNVSWNATTRVLDLSNTATLTLSGDTYSFCRIQLRNSARLQIATVPGPLRIYIDSPEHCGNGAGAGSVSLQQNTDITNLNADPIKLQLYAAGSPNKATSVQFANSSSADTIMAVYAPSSTVSLENNVHVVGAVAAKKVVMQNFTSITYDSRVEDITGSDFARIYQNPAWQECTNDATGVALDSGC